MTDAERTRESLRTMFEDLYAVFDGARFERRDGYDFLFIPQIPVAQFNAAWPHGDAAAPELETAIAEVEAAGVPSSVQLRRESLHGRGIGRDLSTSPRRRSTAGAGTAPA